MRRNERFSLPSNLFVEIRIDQRIDLIGVRRDHRLERFRLFVASRHFPFDFHLRFADPPITRLNELQIRQMIFESTEKIRVFNDGGFSRVLPFLKLIHNLRRVLQLFLL